MNSDNALIGLAWASFREAWFSEIADRLIVVSYDSLASRPEATMKLLYDELDEAPFNHVTYDEPDYDANLGMPGMHAVW
jgi:sulfotransferase